MSKRWMHMLRRDAVDLNGFKAGDSEVFNRIYFRFRNPIYKYVNGRIRDAELAEDVTQEVFLKVYRFRESFDDSQVFSTWLWTVARNTVYDALRKSKGDAEESHDLETFPSSDTDAHSLLELRDMRKLIRSVIKPLTKQQRRVLWMRVVQQLPYAEISNHLGVSLTAAKNLGHRAKLALEQSVHTFPLPVHG